MNDQPATSFRFETRGDFEKVFREYYPSLCRYAFSLLANTAEAEDVVQEAMFRIWEKRAKTEINTSVQAYLFRAVRNHALNCIRKKKVHLAYYADTASGQCDTAAKASDVLYMSELQRRVREAVAKLPAERQRIFIMSRYEGLKYREIADELGISPKTVENQLGRALQALRIDLADYLPLLMLFLSDIFES